MIRGSVYPFVLFLCNIQYVLFPIKLYRKRSRHAKPRRLPFRAGGGAAFVLYGSDQLSPLW